MPTLPGVKVTLSDGYYAASDNNPNADRVLIIAAPGAGAPILSAPYNPELYVTETAVVADYGEGSDGHIAYVQAIRTGASQIYLSATDTSVTNYATDVSVRETEFENALQYADLVEPDIIVAYGFYANEVVDAGTGTDLLADYAVTLGTKCHQLTSETNPCIGIMSVVPLSVTNPATTYSAADIAEYVADLTAAAGSFQDEVGASLKDVLASVEAVTIDAVSVDIGKYLAVTVGEVIIRDQHDETEFTSAAAAVAGQIYSTPLDQGITSAPIMNAIDLAHTFSKSQKLALITDRANPVVLSTDRTIVMLDGWTLASPDENDAESVFNRITTVRICNETIKATRNELEKFIGMQASTARMNSIETKLRSLYTSLKQAYIIKNAEFKIEFNQTTGTLTVNLTIVPFGEIREVDLTVAVKIN